MFATTSGKLLGMHALPLRVMSESKYEGRSGLGCESITEHKGLTSWMRYTFCMICVMLQQGSRTVQCPDWARLAYPIFLVFHVIAEHTDVTSAVRNACLYMDIDNRECALSYICACMQSLLAAR